MKLSQATKYVNYVKKSILINARTWLIFADSVTYTNGAAHTPTMQASDVI